jgi:hypothetical protein
MPRMLRINFNIAFWKPNRHTSALVKKRITQEFNSVSLAKTEIEREKRNKTANS